MSTLLATYAPVYRVTIASKDGHLYQADVERHGWTGDVTPLRGHALRISWGPEGGASTAEAPLTPVATAKATLSVRDDRPGRLAEVAGAPDGAWRLVVRRLTGGPGVAGVVYRGYLQPETYEDSPYGVWGVQSFSFSDGIGLLETRPFAGPGVAGRDDGGDGPYWAWTGPDVRVAGRRRKVERVAASLARILGPLYGAPEGVVGAGEAGGIVTAVDWRPWLPGTTVSADTDPLAAVLTQEVAWLDADGGTRSALDAVRALCARFGARLFQSRGRWNVVQRGLLARLRGAAVPRHTYAPSLVAPGVAAASTRALENLVVDTRTWLQLGPHATPKRGITLPVRSTEVAYAFRPPLDQLLFNGSFETPAPGPVSPIEARPAGWTVPYAGVERFELGSNPADGFSPTFGDAYALKLVGQFGLNPESVASVYQEVNTFLPSTTAWDVELSAFWISQNADFARSQRGGVFVSVTRADGTVLGIKPVAVEMAASALSGKGVRLYVERVPGTTGQRSIPAGAVLHFWRGTGSSATYIGNATLTEDGIGGDKMLVADVDLAVTADDVGAGNARLMTDDVAEAYVWTAGGDGMATSGNAPGSRFGPSTDAYAGHEAWPLVARLSSVATDMRPVEGMIRVTLYGPLPPAGPAISLLVDDVALRVRSAGESGSGAVASRASARAMLPSGVPGLDVSASRAALPVGDGPHSATATALHVEAADGKTYPTSQGALTGWTAGAFAPGQASTERSLDLVAARDGLAQIAGSVTEDGGGLERVRTTYLLRNGQTLSPEQIVRHWPHTALALPATAGAETVYTHAAPRVGMTLELPAGSGEDYAVTGVTRGAGLFAVEIDRPVETSVPAGTRCAYDLLAWWDNADWDVVEAGVFFDGTALDLADDTHFAGEVTLGPS